MDVRRRGRGVSITLKTYLNLSNHLRGRLFRREGSRISRISREEEHGWSRGFPAIALRKSKLKKKKTSKSIKKGKERRRFTQGKLMEGLIRLDNRKHNCLFWRLLPCLVSIEGIIKKQGNGQCVKITGPAVPSQRKFRVYVLTHTSCKHTEISKDACTRRIIDGEKGKETQAHKIKNVSKKEPLVFAEFQLCIFLRNWKKTYLIVHLPTTRDTSQKLRDQAIFSTVCGVVPACS